MAFLLGIGVLVRTYRRITGMWVNGYDAGRASRWAYIMGALLVACLGVSAAVHLTTGLVWPTLACGAVAFLGVVLLGHRFDETLRAELRAAP